MLIKDIKSFSELREVLIKSVDQDDESLIMFNACYSDAVAFIVNYKDVPTPSYISASHDGEIIIEWIKDGMKHAVVSFEGNSQYSYAYRDIEKDYFVPGEFDASVKDRELAQDLKSYLSSY